MNQNNLKRWLCLLAYLGLAGISCWATEHSLHLLIKWMPEIFVWILTIAFFVVASIGTKMIVDALNKESYIENRRRTFWLGVILVLVFWLVCSMPTNTHTFFYNHNIGAVAQEDLEITNKYLNQISDRKVTDSAFFSLHDQVNEKYKEVEGEFNSIAGMRNSGKRGNGEYVRRLLGEINPLLDKEVPGLQIKFNDSPFAWNSTDQRVLSGYEEQKNRCLDQIKDKNYKVSIKNASEADSISTKIEIMEDTIKTMVQVGEIYEDVIQQAEGVALSGYTCIKNNHKYVLFDNAKDEKQYTAENLETRIKRLLSVIDVWIDFLSGKYPVSFLYYVLLSILVDIAAFIFFDITFKNNDN